MYNTGMIVFSHACIVSTILVIWFRTDFVIEVLSALKVNLLKFNLKKADAPSLTYPVYLSTKGFFGRLVGCPWCLGFWLNVAVNATTPYLILQTYILSLLFYFSLSKLSK